MVTYVKNVYDDFFKASARLNALVNAQSNDSIQQNLKKFAEQRAARLQEDGCERN